MNKAEISVIVPIYNIEQYLPKCIDSILAQSFTNFELLLVNDGSPDNCPQICEEYAKIDSRVKVCHKENGGLLSARKEGLSNATGRFVAFVDGDDWVDSYYLCTLLKLAVVNNAQLVVTGHFREFDGKIETSRPTCTGIYSEAAIKEKVLPQAIYNGDFCEHGISTYVWNKLFLRELLVRILFEIPNEIVMGEDAAITYSYLAKTKKIVISSASLYYYRQRNDSIIKSVECTQTENYRLGVLTNYLKTSLAHKLPEENIEMQLTYYLYSQILVRSGGLIYDKNNEVFNPFVNANQYSRVVVYSSGAFGQHLLTANSQSKFFKIVNWIDHDYHELEINGNFVQPISAFDDQEFDHMIVATINYNTFSAIKDELFMMGLDEDKLCEINTNFSEVKHLLNRLGYDDLYNFSEG